MQQWHEILSFTQSVYLMAIMWFSRTTAKYFITQVRSKDSQVKTQIVL
jgi:hypothetical protein